MAPDQPGIALTATATTDVSQGAQWVALDPPPGNKTGQIAHLGVSATGAPTSDGILYFALTDGTTIFALEKMDLINPALAVRSAVAGTGRYMLLVAGPDFRRFFKMLGAKVGNQGPHLRWRVGATFPTGVTALQLDVEWGLDTPGPA